jgi:hypothetical protein
MRAEQSTRQPGANCDAQCISLSASARSAIAAYRAAWPRACGTCHGWGYFTSTYDPSPAGVSLSAGYMTDVDTCRACLDENTCPRCMADWPDDLARTCPACQYECEITPGCPSEHECNCDLAAYYRDEARL